MRRQLRLAIGALGAAAVSMAAYAGTAPGFVDVDAAVAALPSDVEHPAVAAFSMPARKARVVIEKPLALASGTEGQQLFEAQCIACHGVDARGVDGLGVSLVDSGLVAAISEEDLVAFLKVGRMLTDPANVSGAVMPGFAWLAEQDLVALAGHVKSIAQQASETGQRCRIDRSHLRLALWSNPHLV